MGKTANPAPRISGIYFLFSRSIGYLTLRLEPAKNGKVALFLNLNPNTMKKSLLFLFSLSFVFWGCSDQISTVAENDLTTFSDSLFQSSLDSGMIAGAAVIVMQDGELLVDKSYGFASLELEAPMPLHASFEIGSVTKQFTAAAILKLQEMGQLSLDDDFTEYLDFDTRGRTISIRRLLDHTSGIPSYTEMEAFWPFSLHTYPRDSLVRMVEAEDFLFEPGEALIYNNSVWD